MLNAEDYFNMGYDFEIEDEYDQAFKAYKLAARMGNCHALNNLALFYLNGLGTEKNVAKAIELFEQSAETGNSKAAVYLGNILEDGESGSGSVNYESALKWYKYAMDLGDSDGAYFYACMYHYGYGVEKRLLGSFPDIFKTRGR